MRKLVLATAAIFAMVGLASAVDVYVLSYNPDTREVKVKEGDAEKTYKIAEDVKVLIKDKEGNVKEGTFKAVEGRLKFAAKSKKGIKLDVTVKDGTIVEITTTAFGKKGKGGGN